MHEYFKKLTKEEQEIFTRGRESVLDDFDNLCQADAFLGFSEDEFNAVKKFFRFNSKLRNRNKN